MKRDVLCSPCTNDPHLCRICLISQFNTHASEYSSLSRTLSQGRMISDDYARQVKAMKGRVEKQMKEYLTAALLVGFDTGNHPDAHRWAMHWGLHET